MTGDSHEALSQDIIRVEDEYYIRASSSLADARMRVLKHGETFLVLDRSGDCHPVGLHGEQGLYHEGTRFLSRLELRLGHKRLLLLSSSVTGDNAVATADLSNPPLLLGDGSLLPQDHIHFFRATTLSQATLHQRLSIRSYAREAVEFDLSIHFGADFKDIFEVRGLSRAERGTPLEPEVTKDRALLAYRGLDGVMRCTTLTFMPSPSVVRESGVDFSLRLNPGEEATIDLRGQCTADILDARETGEGLCWYSEAAASAHAGLAPESDACRIETSNEQFNDWLGRSEADLRMMLTRTPHGPYPYAGVPWFSAPFGRDAIVTALEMLWVAPSVAAAVLRTLAAYQADAEDPSSDAEPGKILHEARGGEMAALAEVPFRRYYGSIDSTPLFVVLAHAYFERTANFALLEEIWPNIERALAWIDTYGDPDGDGFLEYERRTPHGLANQGWKDSQDSVFHADDVPAPAPIALCEVQAYVYGARMGAAILADALGESARAASLRAQADALRIRFEEQFWLPKLRTYALALDGAKRPCEVRTSNAGQCLLTGIASFAHARQLAETLLGEESFSGWGIRTVASSERCYNPMSYHNGSVWPHDNALIAAGLARYGLKEPVLRIMSGIFDASLFMDLSRMPELFCGFPRRPREGPTCYPIACAPQSWAAGSVHLLLAACLGLQISAREHRILFNTPLLPQFLQQVRMRNLAVGDARVDLNVHLHNDDVSVQVLRREGKVDIVIAK